MSDLSDEILSNEELRLAEELRNSCNRYGQEKEENLNESADVFLKMGKLYLQKASTVEGMLQKITFIRCCALLMGSKVRFQMLKNKEKLSETQNALMHLNQNLFDCAGISNKEWDLFSFSDEIMSELNNKRKKMKTRLAELPKIEDENIFIQEEEKIRAVQELNELSTEYYKDLMKKISLKVIDILGTPPCRFAQVGLGSMARNDITLYSDFEHVIILEDEVMSLPEYHTIMEYFRWYAVIFQVIIIGLGETSIRSVGVKSINDLYSANDKFKNWYYDIITSRGVAFKGMITQSCSNPLCKKVTTDIVELIKPVSKMLQYFLPSILKRTCFVNGDKDVYNDFLTKRKFILESIELQSNENMYSSTNLVLSELATGQKTVLYRSITVLLGSLADIYKVKADSTFDIITKLMKMEIINKEACHNLKYAFAVACEVRMKLALQRKEIIGTDVVDLVGGISLIDHSIVLLHLMGQFVHKFDYFFKNKYLQHDDFRTDYSLNRVAALLRSGRWHEARDLAVSLEGKSYDESQRCMFLARYYFHEAMVNKKKRNEMHMNAEQYCKKAIKVELNGDTLVYSYLCLMEIYTQQGRFKECAELCQKCAGDFQPTQLKTSPYDHWTSFMLYELMNKIWEYANMIEFFEHRAILSKIYSRDQLETGPYAHLKLQFRFIESLAYKNIMNEHEFLAYLDEAVKTEKNIGALCFLKLRLLMAATVDTESPEVLGKKLECFLKGSKKGEKPIDDFNMLHMLVFIIEMQMSLELWEDAYQCLSILEHISSFRTTTVFKPLQTVIKKGLFLHFYKKNYKSCIELLSMVANEEEKRRLGSELSVLLLGTLVNYPTESKDRKMECVQTIFEIYKVIKPPKWYFNALCCLAALTHSEEFSPILEPFAEALCEFEETTLQQSMFYCFLDHYVKFIVKQLYQEGNDINRNFANMLRNFLQWFTHPVIYFVLQEFYPYSAVWKNDEITRYLTQLRFEFVKKNSFRAHTKIEYLYNSAIRYCLDYEKIVKQFWMIINLSHPESRCHIRSIHLLYSMILCAVNLPHCSLLTTDGKYLFWCFESTSDKILDPFRSNISSSHIPSKLAILPKTREHSTTEINNASEEVYLLHILDSQLTEALKDPAKKRKVISRGGVLEQYGCEVVFPDKAVESSTEFETEIDTNPPNFPQGQAVVSPIFKCRPSMKFNKPVLIKMTTFCFAEKSNDARFQVLFKKGHMVEWELLQEVEARRFVQFYVDHFCSYVITLKRALGHIGISLPFHIINDAYIRKDSGSIVASFCLHTKIQEKEEEVFQRNKFVKALIPTHEFLAKLGCEVSLKLRCLTFPDSKFEPIKEGEDKFVITDDILTLLKHSVKFKLVPPPPKEENCTMQVEFDIDINDGEKKSRTFLFEVDWPIVTGNEPEQAPTQTVRLGKIEAQGDVFVGNDGNRVTNH